MILFANKTKLFYPTHLDTEEFQVIHMVLPPKVFHLKGQKKILSQHEKPTQTTKKFPG